MRRSPVAEENPERTFNEDEVAARKRLAFKRARTSKSYSNLSFTSAPAAAKEKELKGELRPD
jgi:hypothetical protein